MPRPELDAIDCKILRSLQKNGRMTNADLAGEIGLSQTPCLRRVKRLEDEGVIAGYVAVLDQERIGLPVSVFAQVKMESHDTKVLSNFERTVGLWPEVIDCYLMTGARDYLMRIVVEDVAAYERFIKQKLTRIEGIGSIESSFALNQIKNVSALPV